MTCSNMAFSLHRSWTALLLLLPLALPLQMLRSEELPDHVSFNSLCCLLDSLKSDGIEFTFETGEVQQLDDKAISYWEGKTFLVMRSNNPVRLFPRKIDSARAWLKDRANQNFTVVEFQRLKLGKKHFFMTLYSTSPVTRTVALWNSNAEFQFSVQGDLLAVDQPSWNRKSFRLYFWNPTGSDLAIVDFDPKTGSFHPVLAVFDSSGTFSDGSGDGPLVPVMRKEHKTKARIRLFDHFTRFQKEIGYLEPGRRFWELASRDKHTLIAYKLAGKISPEADAKYQPTDFFRECLYTTAWIKEELD